jgi:purine-binding chemotaxis protein CheW
MSALHVICKVGDAEYAVSADEVYQMDTYTGATPVPGAAAYMLGLVQIRQQIIPVLDVRTRFGLPAIQPTLESRVVVLKIAERLVGIVVDSAREVQNIPAEQFKAPPSVVTEQSSGFVKSIAQLKNRIIMLLDTPKVIGEEVSHG